MAAQPRSWIESLKAKGLGLCRFDHLEQVDIHPLAKLLQLIDQGDVHAAVDVLKQLGHLRSGR